MEKQKRWANTAAWWIFVTQVGLGEGRMVEIFVIGERSVDAARCQESSQLAAPPPPPKPKKHSYQVVS